MAKEDNLTPFSSEYQPEKNGRPKGSRNRSTIVKKWLSFLSNETNDITGIEEQLTQEDKITLAQIHKAKAGDTSAYKALMDSAHGMPKQEIDQTNTFDGLEVSPISFVKTKQNDTDK